MKLRRAGEAKDEPQQATDCRPPAGLALVREKEEERKDAKPTIRGKRKYNEEEDVWQDIDDPDLGPRVADLATLTDPADLVDAGSLIMHAYNSRAICAVEADSFVKLLKLQGELVRSVKVKPKAQEKEARAAEAPSNHPATSPFRVLPGAAEAVGK